MKALHDRDLAQGYGAVYLPDALARKYPNAERAWGWQYLFPSDRLSVDPRTGIVRHHHLDESGLQKAIRQAAQRAGIPKPIGPHTLRHCFATHLLEAHDDIRTVQELPGHKDVKTTMIYTHVLQRGGLAVRSPLDLYMLPSPGPPHHHMHQPLRRDALPASRPTGNVRLLPKPGGHNEWPPS